MPHRLSSSLFLALIFLAAPALAEERTCDELLGTAREKLGVATDAFNRLGDEGSDSHETRLLAEASCEEAMGCCDLAIEYYEDECGKDAEDILTDASSLYFWIHRTAPLSFFDWKQTQSGGSSDEDLFSSDDYEEIMKKAREEEAEAEPEEIDEPEEPEEVEEPEEPAVHEACTRLEAARELEKKDPFDAVLAYSEVASQFPDHDCGKQAMARVSEIMNPESKADRPSLAKTVSYLKQGLGSKSEADRLRAARDARNLKAQMIVRPLIDALRKEDSPRVRKYLLAALETTHRKKTCEELGDAKRFKDEGEQLAILASLQKIGGQRGAAAMGEFLASKHDKVIEDCYVRLKSMGIDGGMGLAVGFPSVLKRGKPPEVNRCLDLMAELKHPASASAILMRGKGLLSKRQRKGPYFDKAKDTLIAMGWNATWPLIEEGMGSGESRTKQWAQYCVRTITGWQGLSMGTDAWRDRWKQEVASGNYELPYGMKELPR